MNTSIWAGIRVGSTHPMNMRNTPVFRVKGMSTFKVFPNREPSPHKAKKSPNTSSCNPETRNHISWSFHTGSILLAHVSNIIEHALFGTWNVPNLFNLSISDSDG